MTWVLLPAPEWDASQGLPCPPNPGRSPYPARHLSRPQLQPLKLGTSSYLEDPRRPQIQQHQSQAHRLTHPPSHTPQLKQRLSASVIVTWVFLPNTVFTVSLCPHTQTSSIMRTRTFANCCPSTQQASDLLNVLTEQPQACSPCLLNRPPFTHFLSISTFICFIFTKRRKQPETSCS